MDIVSAQSQGAVVPKVADDFPQYTVPPAKAVGPRGKGQRKEWHSPFSAVHHGDPDFLSIRRLSGPRTGSSLGIGGRVVTLLL